MAPVVSPWPKPADAGSVPGRDGDAWWQVTANPKGGFCVGRDVPASY
jgi:hypothetical protein